MLFVLLKRLGHIEVDEFASDSELPELVLQRQQELLLLSEVLGPSPADVPATGMSLQ